MATATSLRNAAGTKNAYDAIPASTTDSNLVTAVPTKKIRVVAYLINQGDTTPSTVQFNSKPGGAGSSIFNPLKYPANGGAVSPKSDGWFETAVGQGLSVTTGAGSTTTVAVVYKEVAP